MIDKIILTITSTLIMITLVVAYLIAKYRKNAIIKAGIIIIY